MGLIKSLENETHGKELMHSYFHPEVKTEQWLNNRPQHRKVFTIRGRQMEALDL